MYRAKKYLVLFLACSVLLSGCGQVLLQDAPADTHNVAESTEPAAEETRPTHMTEPTETVPPTEETEPVSETEAPSAPPETEAATIPHETENAAEPPVTEAPTVPPETEDPGTTGATEGDWNERFCSSCGIWYENIDLVDGICTDCRNGTCFLCGGPTGPDHDCDDYPNVVCPNPDCDWGIYTTGVGIDGIICPKCGTRCI